MTIIQDTREHKGERERVAGQLSALGVQVIRSKLYVGDYQSLDNPRLCIDRKKDLLELCGNVTQQHERFRNELIRAREAGIRLVILCEHGDGIESLSDVHWWHNPRLDKFYWCMQDGRAVRKPSYPRATDGQQLYKCLCTIRDKYDVKVEFCDKESTGKFIYQLLGGE